MPIACSSKKKKNAGLIIVNAFSFVGQQKNLKKSGLSRKRLAILLGAQQSQNGFYYHRVMRSVKTCSIVCHV